MTRVSLTLVSRNAKTGPIPVSTTEKATCPDACPLKAKGCYAKNGPVHIHWLRVSAEGGGMGWRTFCDAIRQLPRGQLWRHNQAGDLPGENNRISEYELTQLVQANKGRNGFTYTHKPVDDTKQGQINRLIIKDANAKGFTINLSADNLREADELASLRIAPVVCILPSDQMTNTQTPEGRKIVICPAVTKAHTTCATCRLCARADRSCIIGFPAHGISKGHVSTLAKQGA